mmetsp:Transcript_11345/g.20871  ORF Transcript_11345/g.20871 Transcript_11345/m.20871 type:complete len:316 (+) Transcript_11345:207-1154(+)|eukprot:CAMPEP_0201868206 /NCGR_PEP_ID=MMETSP0902-20130614/2193_1 /ASSEMBLY_ACC=CAM_ASM_000551 /TAXON_ID=420261 /ORGANISM="Thalassiosira antarctica, Strain CCMP982" /LENGTH=315 /DNA_ID=CAMNT_0048393523 /DNA_START=80 /DNA_END=1027 /DNA_ORIENTATION=-
MSYQDNIDAEIPAEVRMLSGCHDTQTSADANITTFELPDPAGRRGGACTAALLQVLYNDNDGDPQDCSDQSWVEVLRAMRNNLAAEGFTQVPQLSSSRMIEINDPMQIVNNPQGTKRAVLIGINYVGHDPGELSGCHNDVANISKYLKGCLGFEQDNMMVLMDDHRHEEPTYRNIMRAFDWIVSESQPGDTVWIHYSGHGGRLEDQDGDEEDGYDETLCPIDFQTAGQIRDDDLLKHLVKPMKKGVLMTCLMDCCHSGTVLDLPYNFIADGEHAGMERNENFDLGNVMGMLGAVAGAAMASGAVGEIADECCVIL